MTAESTQSPPPALPVPSAEALSDAWIWELLHRGHKGDKLFYRRVCRGAQRVLELGCGYGRLLPFLAEGAAEVVGLDSHPGLLARAAEGLSALPPRLAARVRLVAGDMRGPLPAGPFDRIVLPYNALFCLLSAADQQACLAAARAVASGPEARLVLDAYVIDEAALDADPDPAGDADEEEHVLTILTAEGRVDVFEQNVELPDQRIDALYRLEVTPEEPEPPRTLRQRVGHRFLLPAQIEGVLAAAGWRLVSLDGGFRGGRFTSRSGLMVVTAAPAP